MEPIIYEIYKTMYSMQKLYCQPIVVFNNHINGVDIYWLSNGPQNTIIPNPPKYGNTFEERWRYMYKYVIRVVNINIKNAKIYHMDNMMDIINCKKLFIKSNI